MNMNSVLGSILWIGLCVYSVYSFPSDSDLPADDEPKHSYNIAVMKSTPTTNLVSRDSNITLNCDVINKDPDAALVWNLNSATIFVDGTCYKTDVCDFFQIDSKDNATLTIKKVTDQTAGNYFCQFRNANVEHVVHIKAVVESVSGPKTIEVGDDLHLMCRVTGFPPPQIVRWERQPNATAPKVVLGNTLNFTIPHVSFTHSGIYTCTAFNSESSETSSRSINVNVVKGIVARNPTIYASDTYGNTVNLCCDYSSVKNEAQIKWLKHDKEVYEGPRYQIQSGKSKSCLSILTIKEEDLGNYTCQFSKGVGDGKTPPLAVIDLIGKPSVPELVSVLSEGFTAPLVKWKVKTFSPLNSYQIRVKKPEQSEKDWMIYTNKTIASNNKEEIIEQSFDKLDSDMYDVELVVVNKFGSNTLVSRSAVAVDHHGVEIISPSLQKASGGTGGASRSIGISLFCILFGVILSRL